MMLEIIKKINVRSTIIIILVSGALVLAIIDKDYRAKFADLTSVGIGGYFGQLTPKSSKFFEEQKGE